MAKTNFVPTTGTKVIRSKLTDFGFKSLQATSCLFEPFDELYEAVTMGDTFLHTLTKRLSGLGTVNIALGL